MLFWTHVAPRICCDSPRRIPRQFRRASCRPPRFLRTERSRRANLCPRSLHRAQPLRPSHFAHSWRACSGSGLVRSAGSGRTALGRSRCARLRWVSPRCSRLRPLHASARNERTTQRPSAPRSLQRRRPRHFRGGGIDPPQPSRSARHPVWLGDWRTMGRLLRLGESRPHFRARFSQQPVSWKFPSRFDRPWFRSRRSGASRPLQSLRVRRVCALGTAVFRLKTNRLGAIRQSQRPTSTRRWQVTPRVALANPPAFARRVACSKTVFISPPAVSSGTLSPFPRSSLFSERDFWSRPEDRQNLVADFVYSPKVQVVILPGATHFVHLDREEHGRKMLLDELTSFIGKN
jgi:hypothetical protein